MGGQFRRSLFFNVNKYQLITILPVMVVLIFLIALSGLTYYWAVYIDISLQGSHELVLMQKIFPAVLILFFLLVIFYIYWVFFITNRLLGPFERIVRELDEMIENKKEWRHLKTRDGDEMFDHLIRRINVLIDKI